MKFEKQMKLNAAKKIVTIQNDLYQALRKYAGEHEREILGYSVSITAQNHRSKKLDDVFKHSFPLFEGYLEITEDSIRCECRKV